MKNLSQDGLNELTQEDVKIIDGGSSPNPLNKLMDAISIVLVLG